MSVFKKRNFALFVLIMVTVMGYGMATAQTTTYWTFDNNNEGFETGTFDEQNTPWPFMSFQPSQWSATGGHEDGHIYSGSTTNLNGRLYNILQNGNPAAPSLGNLLGKTLQTDLKRDTGDFISPSGEKVMAYWLIADSQDSNVCNMWLSKVPLSVDINALPLGQWTPNSITVTEANFFPWANCPNNTKTFDELAGSYKYVGFSFLSDQVTPDAGDPWNRYTLVNGVWRLLHYGMYSDSGAIFRIDNFGPTDAMVYDFGDLPDSYHTTHASNGPRHQLGGALRLGSSVQSEPDALPDNSASGDGGEEDGVTRQNGLAGNGWSEGTVASGNGGSINIDIQGGSGVPQVFMDIGGSLSEITLRDASGNALAMPLTAGVHRAYFDIPANTFTSNNNAIAVRVRLSSAGGLAITGVATDGEVEDYIWHFGPNAIALSHFQASPSVLPRWLTLFFILLLAGGATLTLAARSKAGGGENRGG